MRLFIHNLLLFTVLCVLNIIDCRNIPSITRNRQHVYRQAAFSSPHQHLPFHRSNHNYPGPVRSLTFRTQRTNTNRNSNAGFSAPRAFLADGYANSFLNTMECLTPTNARGFCSTFRQCVPSFFTEDGQLEAPALAELISFSIGFCNTTLPVDNRRYKKYSTVGDRIICCPGSSRINGPAKKTKSETTGELLVDIYDTRLEKNSPYSANGEPTVVGVNQPGNPQTPSSEVSNEDGNLKSNEKFSVQLLSAKNDDRETIIEQLSPEVYSATDASTVIKISPEPVVGANGKFTIGSNGVLIERLTTPKPGPVASFSEKLSEVDSVSHINIKAEADIDSKPLLIASVEELPQVKHYMRYKSPKFSAKIASLPLDKSVGSDELDEIAMRQAKISIIVEDLSGESREYTRITESLRPESQNDILNVENDAIVPKIENSFKESEKVNAVPEVLNHDVPSKTQNDNVDPEPRATTILPLENILEDEPVFTSILPPVENETEKVFRDEVRTTTEVDPLFDSANEHQSTTQVDTLFDSVAGNEQQSITTGVEHLLDSANDYQSTTESRPYYYSVANDYQNVTQEEPVFKSITNGYENTTEVGPSFYSVDNDQQPTTEGEPTFDFVANDQGTTASEIQYDAIANDHRIATEPAPISTSESNKVPTESSPQSDDSNIIENQNSTEAIPRSDSVDDETQTTASYFIKNENSADDIQTTARSYILNDENRADDIQTTTGSYNLKNENRADVIQPTTGSYGLNDENRSDEIQSTVGSNSVKNENRAGDIQTTTGTYGLNDENRSDEIQSTVGSIFSKNENRPEEIQTTARSYILNDENSADEIQTTTGSNNLKNENRADEIQTTTGSNIATNENRSDETQKTTISYIAKNDNRPEIQTTTGFYISKNENIVSEIVNDDTVSTERTVATTVQANTLEQEKSHLYDTTVRPDVQNDEEIPETTTPLYIRLDLEGSNNDAIIPDTTTVRSDNVEHEEPIVNDNSDHSKTNPALIKDSGVINNGLAKPSSGVIKIANSAEGIDQSDENPLYTSYEKAQEDFSYSPEHFSSEEKSDSAKVKGFIPAYTVIKPFVKPSPFSSIRERKPILQISSINNKNLGQFHTLHEDDSLENNSEDIEYSPRLPVGQLFQKQVSIGKNKINAKADTTSEESESDEEMASDDQDNEEDQFEEKIYFQNAGEYPKNISTTTTTQSSVDDVPSPITITSAPIQVEATKPSTSIVIGSTSTAPPTTTQDIETTKATVNPSTSPTPISTPEDDSSEFEEESSGSMGISSTTLKTTSLEPSAPDIHVNNPTTTPNSPEEIIHTTQHSQISSSQGTEISSEATTAQNSIPTDVSSSTISSTITTSSSTIATSSSTIATSSSTIGSTESTPESISTSTEPQLSSISPTSSTTTQNATQENFPVSSTPAPEDIPTTQQNSADTPYETTEAPATAEPEPEPIQITDRPAVALPEYKILEPCKNQDYFRGLQEPDQNHYPWLATVVGGTRPFCSATLITNQHVLTAAHFLSNITVSDVYHMRVHIGYRASENGATMGPYAVRKVIKVVRHKGFSFEKLYNDIAILILDRPVHFNDNISPVCLSSGKTSYAEKEAIETGWVEDPPTKHISKHHPFIDPQIQKYFSFGYHNVTWSLMEASNTVKSNEECRANYGFLEKNGIDITKSMVCAGSPEGKACGFRGNSGAPLVVSNDGKPEQIGIVSWGIGCGHFPSVFTRVSSFIPWIERVVFHTR